MRIFLLFGLLLLAPRAAFQAEERPDAAISGKVSINGNPAAGVEVILSLGSSGKDLDDGTRQWRTHTAADGRYTFKGLRAGQYTLSLPASSYIAQDSASRLGPIKSRYVAAGESADDLDFSLTHGGAITGRVTLADGRPMAGAQIRLERLNESGESTGFHGFGQEVKTDDRGVYRVYGLNPGRYRVSARLFTSYSLQPIASSLADAYYPGVPDAASASVVELESGGEAADIDIRMGAPQKTFSITGRVVNAETGEPIAGLLVGSAGGVYRDYATGKIESDQASDSFGQFQLRGLPPGRYNVFPSIERGDAGSYKESYPEVTRVEVIDSDVSGVQLRVSHGASVSGTVVILGADVPTSPDSLEINIVTGGAEAEKGLEIGPDGAFRVSGLSPGWGQFLVTPWVDGKSSGLLRLLGVERDGIDQTDRLRIEPGEQMTGVKIIVGYGIGSIQITTRLQGGAPEPGDDLFIFGSPADFPANTWAAHLQPGASLLIPGLTDGKYVLSFALSRNGRGFLHFDSSTNQTVTVSGGGCTKISVVLDLTKLQGTVP